MADTLTFVLQLLLVIVLEGGVHGDGVEEEDLGRPTLLAAYGGGSVGLQEDLNTREPAPGGDEELAVSSIADFKVQHLPSIAASQYQRKLGKGSSTYKTLSESKGARWVMTRLALNMLNVRNVTSKDFLRLYKLLV